MTIPIGEEYTFKIQVLQPDSFLPMDVTGYLGSLNIFRQKDHNDKPVSNISIVPVFGEEIDGKMVGTIQASQTNGITIDPFDIGDMADQGYIKYNYSGFISIDKSGSSSVLTTIPRVRFVNTGV